MLLNMNLFHPIQIYDGQISHQSGIKLPRQTGWLLKSNQLKKLNKFKDTFQKAITPLIPWSITRKLLYHPKQIDKSVWRLLRRRKRLWDLHTQTGCDALKDECRKVRDLCKLTIDRSRTTYERQLTYDSLTCRTKRNYGIPSLLILENPVVWLADSDLSKTEKLSDNYKEIYFVSTIVDMHPMNIIEVVTMKQVLVTTRKAFCWLNQITLGNSPGPDRMHPQLISPLVDIISEPLSELFRMIHSQERHPKGQKDALISSVLES